MFMYGKGESNASVRGDDEANSDDSESEQGFAISDRYYTAKQGSVSDGGVGE
jgi:hypothetical protein